jgi:DNA transformation protein and related proteins
MTVSAGFIELLHELLAPLGTISVRRMFGGAGLYCDSQIIGFIDDDTLFFKTDEAGRAAFEAEGLGPFTYSTKNGDGMLLSYWRAPERLLDDPEEMVVWAGDAITVARREALRKKPSKRSAGPRKRSAAAKRRSSPQKKT